MKGEGHKTGLARNKRKDCIGAPERRRQAEIWTCHYETVAKSLDLHECMQHGKHRGGEEATVYQKKKKKVI